MFGTAIAELGCAVDHVADALRAVEEIDLDRAEARTALVELERQRERLDAAIGGYLSDLEARGVHARDGAYSMANWLTARTGQRRATTGARLHLARTLRSMPATAAAVAAGEITATHASVLTRARNPRTLDAFARDEAMLVGTARKLTADQLVQVVEFWLRHHDLDGAEPDPEDRDRFWLSQTLDGRLKGNFDLGGDLAMTVKVSVDELMGQLLARDRANREADPTDPGIDEIPSQRRARALGELCERAAASPANPSRRQPLLTLHTTLDTLTASGDPTDWRAELEQAWSAVIPTSVIDLWSCDCWITQVVIRGADGQPLDAGREIRIANRAMRRALVARDGACCAVPGCDRPIGWCDAHHIVWWTKGGETKLDNLVFLCRWHHRRVHAADLSVAMVDRRPLFTLADGRPIRDTARRPVPPGDPPHWRAA